MSAFENSCAEKAADAIALERESEFDVYRYDFWNMNAFPANKPYIERVAKAWRALDAEVDSLSEAIEQTVASL
jgi:hypothetical protein